MFSRTAEQHQTKFDVQAVHGDSEDKCNERQWRRFLVNSPLQPGLASRGPPLGSHHYQVHKQYTHFNSNISF